MATYISKNFTLEEFIKSDTAIKYKIDNTPNSTQRANIERLVHFLLQPIRDAFGQYIIIGSGFRSSKLNAKVGGVSNSQHLCNGKSAAADLTLYKKGDTLVQKRKKNQELFDFIRQMRDKKLIVFDQLIFEKGGKEGPDWVHISYNIDNNRNQVLKIK